MDMEEEFGSVLYSKVADNQVNLESPFVNDGMIRISDVVERDQLPLLTIANFKA